MTMATGDIKNNLYRLQTELRHVRYPKDMDFTSLAKGSPGEFVAILRYVMCEFSRPLAELILTSNVALMQTSSNHKFLEGVYKVLRDQFGYVPKITLPQFFSTRSFAEHKILLTIDIISLARRKHKQLRKLQTRSQSGHECNKSIKKASQLPDVSLPENFKPCHNSTLSVPNSPLAPTPPGPQLAQQPSGPENTPAVKIVVVGETPAQPLRLEDETASFCVTDRGRSDELDAGVTPRRQRRGVGGRNGRELSPTTTHHDAPILESELRTHPVIRDLAITYGDLVNRVRTLEEQMDTLTINSRKTQQRRDAQILLLENKVKLLEAQITAQRIPSSTSQPHDVIISDVIDHVHRSSAHSRSPDSEGDDVGHLLETVVEEQDSDSVIIDEGVGSEGHSGSLGSDRGSVESALQSTHNSSGAAHSALEDKAEDQEGITGDGGLSGKKMAPFLKENEQLQAQAVRIQMMLSDTEKTLNVQSSLGADA